jgi:hypothetical protein
MVESAVFPSGFGVKVQAQLAHAVHLIVLPSHVAWYLFVPILYDFSVTEVPEALIRNVNSVSPWNGKLLTVPIHVPSIGSVEELPYFAASVKAFGVLSNFSNSRLRP